MNEENMCGLNDRIYNTDEETQRRLFDEYQQLIRFMAYKSFARVKHHGVDVQDFIQEGRIALYDALCTYREDKEASFTTYFYIICQRRMASLVRKQLRQKHQILNNARSFHEELYEDSYLMDVIEDSKAVNPFEEVAEKERMEEITSALENNLSSLEKEILDLKMKGFDYVEIAKILERPVKTIDNGLQRLKKKVLRLY